MAGDPLGDFSPIDFEANLNAEQFAAVTAPPGPALVLAGAGSGKTRTLTYRVAYLLTQNVHPGSILLLTFTNKAAREMLGRVEELTGVPRFQFWGGTFHHIGQKTLRMHGEAIGVEPSFTILDEGDSDALIGEVIREHDSAFLKKKDNPKARVIGDLISYARNTQRSLSEIVNHRYGDFAPRLVESVLAFAKLYETRKRERQLCDYDDLLELWLKLLRTSEEVRQRYQKRFEHILVDEYQDTNALQSAIIDTLAARHQIMAVGDDAQCIYTWRGANFENIATFRERHPGTTIYKIETNYRSTPEILRLANGVLNGQAIDVAYAKELRAVKPGRLPPYVVPLVDTRAQARFLISRISGLVDEGYALSEIAVLYRAHYQALDAQIELSKRGIPFIITSGVRFFEQAHIRDLVAQLRFLVNPGDQPAFKRFAALLPAIGEKTAERLHRLALDLAQKSGRTPVAVLNDEAFLKKVPEAAREIWEPLAASLQEVEEALRPGTRQPAEEDLFGGNGHGRNGQHRPAPRDRPATPQEIVQLAIEGWYGDYLRLLHTNWQQRREDLDSLVGFAARFEDMNELLAQLVLLNSETSDRSAEPDEDALRLTTVHQAKGLEFPVVFVLGLADGLFPLRRAIEEGDVEEERRLFYVAVTRAQEELYLAYPMLSAQGGGPMRLEPSRFLEEIPQEHYEILRISQPGW